MEGLDAHILRILYAYYDTHRGNPKMALADLRAKLECDDLELLHEKLSTLRTFASLEGNFLEGREAGLVWLTPDGMSIAKLLLPEEPQETSDVLTEVLPITAKHCSGISAFGRRRGFRIFPVLPNRCFGRNLARTASAS